MSRDPYEQSRGKLRVTSERLSDIDARRTAPQQDASASERAAKNARYRGSKQALRDPLKAAAGKEVDRALGSAATPEESRLVAANALALVADVQRDLRLTSPGPFVAHHVMRFGVNSALAGFYTQKAADSAFDSDRGLALLEAAHRCEQQATRAMTAVEAAMRASGSHKPAPLDLTKAIADASQERPR